MEYERMNKKGSIVLRDIVFIVVVFAAMMALTSVFVFNMADTYSNTDMRTEYSAENSVGNLGDTVLVNVSASTSTMKDYTEGDEGLLGSFGSITGIIFGAPKILWEIVKIPVYVGSAITSMMVALRLPGAITLIVGGAISIIIYAIIIFVIISALLKGGKV